MKGVNDVMTKDLTFEYFLGNESEQFSFVKIPKLFFTDAKFEGLSYGAKILYGLLLDRMGLSKKNKWLDEQNRVFVIYTIESIGEDFHISRTVAIRFLKELEDFGLIEKKRRPNAAALIYVKNFIVSEESEGMKTSENQGSLEYGFPEVQNVEVQNMDFHPVAENQGSPEYGFPEVQNVEVQNMDSNKTNINTLDDESSSDRKNKEDIKEYLCKKIDYQEILESRRSEEEKKLCEKILGGLVNLIALPKKQYKIDNASLPADMVIQKVIENLSHENFKEVLNNITVNGSETIYNINSYIIVCFFKMQKVKKIPKDKECSFNQRDYDFDALEKELLAN